MAADGFPATWSWTGGDCSAVEVIRLVWMLTSENIDPLVASRKLRLEPRWVTIQITSAANVRALSLDDTVGLKARAWHDRFVIRDIIDLRAVAGAFSFVDLENLARRRRTY